MASFSSLIFMCMLCSAWTAQNFQPVSVCPKDEDNWKAESATKNCQGDTPDYLCAAIENQPNKYGQICTKYGLTPAKKCAVLNEQTYNLDSVDCKADSGCPQDPYIPSELWKYPICYEDFYGTTTMAAASTTLKTTNETTGSPPSSGDDGSKTGVVVGVVIFLILLIIGVVILVVCYRKNQFGFQDKVDKGITDFQALFQHRGTEDVGKGETPEQSEPLMQQDVEKGQSQPQIKQEPVYAKPDKDKMKKDSKPANSKSTSDSKGKEHIHDEEKDDPKQKINKLNELEKYLVHILKQELGVNDLKEKAVIHSKSINEHFSEPLRKDLQNVKDLSDYSKLDMSLVFALLRNFCEDIMPPSRGWDYEPPDDETHVGADIERIRSMWNKYCDDDLQFKYLDDVYNRMKQKYGTVAVHGNDGVGKFPSKHEENTEGFEKTKDKIQSVKLNEDCTVEKGIVITENISTALKILNTRNVVILKGVIGCGKTHTLKAIQNHFHDKNLETAWVEPWNILKKISESKEKPTILLCDNLFGRFGSSVFSQNAVDQIEEVLKAIERSEQTTKVAIGIHTHVYDEVKKTLKLNFLHQKNITVEMDNLSEAETLLIFKEQLTKGHCKMDPNCWFKPVGFQSVLDKLSRNQGHIGGPFLSLMYCNQHELFSDETFSVNPIQTLVQHIQKMRDNSPKLYNCLIYLMCVQQHNLENEVEKWAGHISVEITKHNLIDLAKTSCLLHVDNKIAALAHDLLTTVLFKCAAEKTVIFFPVLQLCQSDVFLQLLRPTGSTHSDLYFEYLPDLTNRDVGRMCTYRLARMYKKQEINHPLMAVELVKEKYARYSTHAPKGLSLINVP